MVIRESFVRLLKQKPISKITIKEICDDADINRSTFYAHYTDQYDLLNQIEKEVIDDINQYLNRYDFRSSSHAPIEMLDIILKYIKQNSELFDLFLNKGDFSFQQNIIEVIRKQHFTQIPMNSSLSQEDIEYIYLFFVNGALGVVREWLLSDMKKPEKSMAELILSMESSKYHAK